MKEKSNPKSIVSVYGYSYDGGSGRLQQPVVGPGG